MDFSEKTPFPKDPFFRTRLMYSKKGVVYKLHAGWFINRTPGEFINRGLFINLKVFSVEILQKEMKV